MKYNLKPEHPEWLTLIQTLESQLSPPWPLQACCLISVHNFVILALCAKLTVLLARRAGVMPELFFIHKCTSNVKHNTVVTHLSAPNVSLMFLHYFCQINFKMFVTYCIKNIRTFKHARMDQSGSTQAKHENSERHLLTTLRVINFVIHVLVFGSILFALWRVRMVQIAQNY